MPWITDLCPDRSSQSVVHELCASDETLRVESTPQPSEVGILLCSGAACWQAIREAIAAADIVGAQTIVVHLNRSISPWHELAAGAIDVMQWAGDCAPIGDKIGRIMEVERIIRSRDVTDKFVGSSPALLRALRELVTAARFGSGPILILGETGTGKELAAQVAHRIDTNCSAGQLVIVDCTTIVPGLLGSELFGHERGAFTGAVSARSGACAAANGGTLFLDEVGELPLDLQPEFMRVIQEGAYKHVGGDRWQRSSFRLICATNRDLAEEVDAGRFRSDLYYRVAASTIRMPPLRERGDDALDLFQHFYRQAKGDEPDVGLDDTVRTAICTRTFGGNLRDLRQLAHRIAARHVGAGPITPGELPEQDRPKSDSVSAPDAPFTSAAGFAQAVRQMVIGGTTLRTLLDEAGRLAIEAALDESDGKVRAAAQRLGVSDRALQLRRANLRKQG